MKILYIHQYFTTRNGASGTRSFEFAKHLSKQGHTVTVLTGDSLLSSYKDENANLFTKEFYIDGIKIIAIKNNYSNYMGFLQRIFSFLTFMFFSTLIGLKLKEYEIVYASSTPLTVAIPALLIKKIKKIPYVFEVRDLWPEAPIQIGAIKSPIVAKLLKFLERITYQEADHIVALSPGMEQGVINAGISPERVSMIPNCSDLDLFGDIDVKRVKELMDRYNLYNKFVVVHGGSMGIANGLDYIVKAAIELRQNNNIVFMITGDGKTRPELEKMCREHNLNNVILTGSIPRREMPSILALSDITITCFKNLPVLATNSPNKFFDSLAAGKPVIVNSSGWTKDIVEKQNIGFYVDPSNPKKLADLLLVLKNNKKVLGKMGQKARILAEEQYDRIKLAKKVEMVISNSLNKGNLLLVEKV